MRLIDAEQIGLTDMEIIMCDGNYKKALEMLIDKIANAPSIDAVQVIRCKDCKHWDVRYCHNQWWGDGHVYYTPPIKTEDGYCDWAERKES